MTIVGNAVYGLLIGFLLLLLLAFLGMSIGSLVTGSVIIGAVAFCIYAALGRSRASKPLWVSPVFSALPISAIAALEVGASVWTFCVATATVLVAGVSGAHLGAWLRPTNRLRKS
jgi:hypothetical protein